ncbi:MAG TPA: DNAase, partial [Gammaproteobacteria bacterium]|nr:DNAase [Gammaproteobacteria bacterium]
QLLDDAGVRGVDYFLVVSVDLNNVDRVREIADQRVNVFASAGVHPNEVAKRPVEYP